MICLFKKNPAARSAAIKAACSGDEETLRKVLLEAGRLDPALAPGQWRWCPDDVTLARDDGSKFSVRAGSVVLVSTMAALRDPKFWSQPAQFRLDRQQQPDLLFGHVVHTCLGRELAMAQITPTIAALLQRGSVERSLAELKIKWLGPYPDSAMITYDHPAQDRQSGVRNQNGVLFAVPVTQGIAADEVNAAIERAFASETYRQALDNVGVIHFLSLTAIDIPAPTSPQTLCLLEINCDGPAQAGALKAIAAIEAHLREALAMTDLPEQANLWQFLKQFQIAMHGKPWGATSLNFFGLPGLSVCDISQERRLADFARRAVDAYQHKELGRSSRPAAVLSHVRRLIRQDPRLSADDDWRPWVAKGAEFEGLLLKPQDQTLPLNGWDEEKRPALWKLVLQSGLFKDFSFNFIAIGVIASGALYFALFANEGAQQFSILSLPWLVLQGLFPRWSFLHCWLAVCLARCAGKKTAIRSMAGDPLRNSCVNLHGVKICPGTSRTTLPW